MVKSWGLNSIVEKGKADALFVNTLDQALFLFESNAHIICSTPEGRPRLRPGGYAGLAASPRPHGLG